MRITELHWQADPTERFRHLLDLPWPILLDSCCDQSGQGHYDIFSADPYATFEYAEGLGQITRHGAQQSIRCTPFQYLQELLGSCQDEVGEWPFSGGAMGYFSYELGRPCVDLRTEPHYRSDFPEMAIGIYDWAVVADHQTQRCHLVSQERNPQTTLIWEDLCDRLNRQMPPPDKAYRVLQPFSSNFTREAYAQAFATAKNYIQAGDCYQVNLAQRFAASSEGSLWPAYCRSRQVNPAPFSAYFRHPAVEIASASPERFLQVHQNQVETRPIKGTRVRVVGKDEGQQRQELRDSFKDQAENLMIVDLLRNDLSKNCKSGTVKVPQLFEVESFATVHHLVSTVTGELREGRTALDLLEGCFPGGSITGAPKRRAMEIIEDLEPQLRGVYCGSLGYIGFDGRMDSNIAIRTMVQSGGQTCLHAGGGLVQDSKMEAEYQECLDKAAAMLEVLQAFQSD